MISVIETFNSIDTVKLVIVFTVLPIVFLIIYQVARAINTLSEEERKVFLQSIFKGFSLSGLMLQIFSSFIVLNGGKSKVTEDNLKGDNLYKIKDKEMDDYLREEYAHSKNTRMVFINLFVIFTFAVIIGFIWLDRLSSETRITLGCLYFGFSCFVLFIIKSCYARTAVILSILEDRSKKVDMYNYFTRYKKSEQLNEHDVDFLRLVNLSRSERERKTSHPYEIVFKNIQGSTFSLGKGRIKIGDNVKAADDTNK
ncbi:hypothetical protein [Kluyvera intermedia]|uniref:ABC transporter ATP-binding protein n=1 Tax=Kluyvera intermedia TaxID=61648 RepID=A0ABX6DHI5_KLUIN|nr:hypothetical protein [Kluyvera intermedia]QGH28251.1 hypothetical protein GHC21_00630 [Kluyvera intermedia]QGH37233.1 hypothetical protein GHC38_00630 [Kluyvera intermedia]